MKSFHLNRGLPIHLLPILVILLVTVIYTWPLLSRLTIAIPGSPEIVPDTTETVWSIGWVHQALSQGKSVWQTDRLFFPYGADLRFNVFGLLQGLIAYPFVLLLGVVGASNIVIILTMLLNGTFAYFLVYDHVQHPIAASLASICHLLSIAVVWHFTVGRNALPSVWIVSASLLCLKSLLDAPNIWKGFLLGLLLIAAFFTDLQVVVFTFIWVLLYIAYYFCKNGFAKSSRPRIAPILIAFSMFALAFTLVLLPVISDLNQGDFPHPSLDDAAHYAFSINDFILPQIIPYIYGFDFMVATVLAVIFFRWQGEYRFWFVASLIFLILALGPYLKPTHIPLPYALVSIWSPLQNFRAVYRFVIPASIGFTLITGYVLARLIPKIHSQVVVFLVCAIFILLRTSYTIVTEPFKTQMYPRYAFYEQIEKDSDDYVIVEIPFGIRSGLDRIGEGGERLQYYQPVHGKAILNGSLARLPVSLFDFYRSHPALLFFSGDLSIDRSRLNSDFSNILKWIEPRYVLVHGSLLSGAQLEEIGLFLDHQPQLQKIGFENDLIIYKVIP